MSDEGIEATSSGPADDSNEKPMQPDTELAEEDPQYMSVEEDGQDAFDSMWQESDAIWQGASE